MACVHYPVALLVWMTPAGRKQTTNLQGTRLRVVAYRWNQGDRLLSYGASVFRETGNDQDTINMTKLQERARERLTQNPVHVKIPAMVTTTPDLHYLLKKLVYKLGCKSPHKSEVIHLLELSNKDDVVLRMGQDGEVSGFDIRDWSIANVVFMSIGIYDRLQADERVEKTQHAEMKRQYAQKIDELQRAIDTVKTLVSSK